MTNWDLLLSDDAQSIMVRFATGELSTRQVTKSFTGTKYAGEFRNLVRSGGTHRARALARKALNRRSLLSK